MGTKTNVDNEEAKQVLKSAFADARSGDFKHNEFETFITSIITGSHLTFKYILFTALLARATNSQANPLCLQAGSELDGAYDARSLCHEVIVPFEKDSLDKILGGSNEPFLNKPARFPELNPANPVRKGNDQRELDEICHWLPKIAAADEAYSCLCFFLSEALRLMDERTDLESQYLAEAKADRVELSNFLHLLLQESHEGESLTLVVANVYNLLYAENPEVSIEVHPVNQCGASSKEISDLDIKENGVLVLANELKDKKFTETDVTHALDKVAEAGGNQMYFIVGSNAEFVGSDLQSVIDKYREKNILVNVVSIEDFLDTVYPLCRNSSMDTVVEYTVGILKDTKFKKSTADYFYRAIDSLPDDDE